MISSTNSCWISIWLRKIVNISQFLSRLPVVLFISLVIIVCWWLQNTRRKGKIKFISILRREWNKIISLSCSQSRRFIFFSFLSHFTSHMCCLSTTINVEWVTKQNIRYGNTTHIETFLDFMNWWYLLADKILFWNLKSFYRFHDRQHFDTLMSNNSHI